jgi:hypothetical protein
LIELLPLTQKAAKEWVNKTHRHLDYPTGDVVRAGLGVDGELVAVASAGRPGARMLDDGRTLEITRVAADAEPSVNACSRLYSAIRRAGLSLGWKRFVTYTREDESGGSVKAAGFKDCGLAGGGEWDRPSRRRKAAVQPIRKRRWMWPCPKCGGAQCDCICDPAIEAA